MPIPTTKNGLSAFDCISALQKYIRRGMEREAYEVAIEMAESGGNLCKMLTNRLRVIMCEDIGTADQQAVVFADTCVRQAEYFVEKGKGCALQLANAVMALCRAQKTREADHLVIAVMVARENGAKPTIHDFIYDHHTMKGRKLGRGIDYFFEESAKLSNQKPGDDPYRAEAYAALKDRKPASSGSPKPAHKRSGSADANLFKQESSDAT